MANEAIKHSKHVQDAERRITANRPHFDETCRQCGKVFHLASACRSSGTAQPKAKGGGKKGERGKSAGTVKTCWNCVENDHMSSQCPKKKVHAVEDLTAASEVGNQDTTWLDGSYFDLGSVSEGIFEPRGAVAKICSLGLCVCVCESANVNIEIDSGAGVSCLLASVGVDTCPLHETRLSMCAGHNVVAGGGKVHELGARILGLEAEGVRGDVVNLLVRFRVMNIGKALLLTQDLGRCGLGDCLPF